ncbi:hypothetical protein ACFX1X_034714 [Malus domestica]
MELLAMVLAGFIRGWVAAVNEGGGKIGKVRSGGKFGNEVVGGGKSSVNGRGGIPTLGRLVGKVGAKSFRGAAPPAKAEEIDNVKNIAMTNNHLQ